MPTAVIDPAQPHYTVTVVIEVADEQRESFLAEIGQVIQDFISLQPGFVSASFHRRIDGPGVLNYAQWRSAEDYDNFSLHPEFGPRVIGVFQRHGAMPVFGRYLPVACYTAPA
jgi:hypothetical protein